MLIGPHASASGSALSKLKYVNWILAASVLIALVFLLFGFLQNRRLRSENRQLQFQLQRSPATHPCDSPHLGDIVPPIETETLDGKRVTIGYEGRSRYLLFFLSFKCNECVSQLANWNEIAKRAKAKNVMVLGLMTDKEGIPLDAPERAFDIVKAHDTALLRAYRINITPTVMLVSEHGRTQWVNAGSLSDASAQELLSIINGDTAIE